MWNAAPECDNRMQNIHSFMNVPPTQHQNSPKSTSASSPGPCVWGTVTTRSVLSNSKFTWAT